VQAGGGGPGGLGLQPDEGGPREAPQPGLGGARLRVVPGDAGAEPAEHGHAMQKDHVGVGRDDDVAGAGTGEPGHAP